MGNLVFQATLGGQVNLVGPNTASTFNINIPATAGNMVTTGDTGTVTNTMCATSVYTAPGTIGSGTPNTGAFTTLAASSTVTLSGGTANGVAYLNGSKVVTSGSALTFDGTTFGVSGAVTGDSFKKGISGNFIVGGGSGGTTYIDSGSATAIIFRPSGTEQMRLDTSGNLGLGVTPSAWGSTNGGAIQFGSGYSSLYSYSNAVTLGSNVYYNAGNKYFASGVGASAYQQLGGVHYWLTAGSGTAGNALSFTQAMTLDASGNLGVGVTSPSAKIEASSHIKTAGDFIATGGGYSARLGYQSFVSTGGFNLFTGDAVPLVFGTNSTERARIDSSGNLLVGTTSQILTEKFGVVNTGDVYVQVLKGGSTGQYTQGIWNPATSGNNLFTVFLTEGAATARGSVTYNRGGGLVAFNTTSDYRAKTVNGIVENALAKVAALKPSTGRMNGAEYDIDFFVAHELQEVVPSAVTGEKDAVNEDGTPNYQMVDKSALIPLLTAAIQEQQAIITQLQADVAALKGQA